MKSTVILRSSSAVTNGKGYAMAAGSTVRQFEEKKRGKNTGNMNTDDNSTGGGKGPFLKKGGRSPDVEDRPPLPVIRKSVSRVRQRPDRDGLRLYTFHEPCHERHRR